VRILVQVFIFILFELVGMGPQQGLVPTVPAEHGKGGGFELSVSASLIPMHISL
jgi:hypothetical protein